MSEQVQTKIEKLSPKNDESTRRLFKGHPEGYLRFGDGGYVLPVNYSEHAEAIRNMPIRPDDLWVTTFARSGTTVTQELLWLLKNNLDYDRATKTPLGQRYAFLESYAFRHEQMLNPEKYNMDPTILSRMTHPAYKLVEDVPPPRYFKTHLPLSLLPPSLLETCKLVYVARDPRDVAVSYYHHNKLIKFHDFKGDFKDFWNLFVVDSVAYCPFFKHVKEAWTHRNHPNMMFIFYEDLIKDMPAVIFQLSKFLGKSYSKQEILKLSQHVSIENFRKNDSVNPPVLNDPSVGIVNDNAEPFIRKGKSGGWREYFDAEMAAQAQRWMQRHLADTDLTFPQT